MNFYEWLKRQTDRDTITGDLARDALRDNGAETVSDTLAAWEQHLRNHRADAAALEALNQAWTSYQAFRRRHSEE